MQLNIVGNQRLVTAHMLQVEFKSQALQAKHSVFHVKIDKMMINECQHPLERRLLRTPQRLTSAGHLHESIQEDLFPLFLSLMATDFSLVVQLACP